MPVVAVAVGLIGSHAVEGGIAGSPISRALVRAIPRSRARHSLEITDPHNSVPRMAGPESSQRLLRPEARKSYRLQAQVAAHPYVQDHRACWGPLRTRQRPRTREREEPEDERTERTRSRFGLAALRCAVQALRACT